MNAPGRALLAAAGWLCLGLGAAGAVLPLLPTTPFLLLSIACLARSSPRASEWLLGHRWLGPYLRDYREGRGVRAAHKAVALATLWMTIALSAIFATQSLAVRLLLGGVAVGVTWHLLSLPTRTDDPPGA